MFKIRCRLNKFQTGYLDDFNDLIMKWNNEWKKKPIALSFILIIEKIKQLQKEKKLLFWPGILYEILKTIFYMKNILTLILIN